MNKEDQRFLEGAGFRKSPENGLHSDYTYYCLEDPVYGNIVYYHAFYMMCWYRPDRDRVGIHRPYIFRRASGALPLLLDRARAGIMRAVREDYAPTQEEIFDLKRRGYSNTSLLLGRNDRWKRGLRDIRFKEGWVIETDPAENGSIYTSLDELLLANPALR